MTNKDRIDITDAKILSEAIDKISPKIKENDETFIQILKNWKTEKERLKSDTLKDKFNSNIQLGDELVSVLPDFDCLLNEKNERLYSHIEHIWDSHYKTEKIFKGIFNSHISTENPNEIEQILIENDIENSEILIQHAKGLTNTLRKAIFYNWCVRLLISQSIAFIKDNDEDAFLIALKAIVKYTADKVIPGASFAMLAAELSKLLDSEMQRDIKIKSTDSELVVLEAINQRLTDLIAVIKSAEKI